MKVSGTSLDPICFSKKSKENDEATIKEKILSLKQELNELKKKKNEELLREDKKRIEKLEKQITELEKKLRDIKTKIASKKNKKKRMKIIKILLIMKRAKVRILMNSFEQYYSICYLQLKNLFFLI